MQKLPIQNSYLELSLCNDKCLINCSQSKNKYFFGDHLDALWESLNLLYLATKKITLSTDFNVRIILKVDLILSYAP